MRFACGSLKNAQHQLKGNLITVLRAWGQGTQWDQLFPAPLRIGREIKLNFKNSCDINCSEKDVRESQGRVLRQEGSQAPRWSLTQVRPHHHHTPTLGFTPRLWGRQHGFGLASFGSQSRQTSDLSVILCNFKFLLWGNIQPSVQKR